MVYFGQALMLRNISILSQTLINVFDDAIISLYKSFTPQSIMTTWAVQPTDYGNEVKIWADVFDGSVSYTHLTLPTRNCV